jgi:heme A synthase
VTTSVCSALYRPWLHRIALVTAVAVFPLVLVGAGVTSTDSGMAYETGFFSNGVLWNPPGWMGNLDTLLEHGHRLLGRTVGVLAILLAAAAWRSGGAVRTMSIVTLLAICVQGVMGILRVNLISTGWAMVHGVSGQVCFCLACVTALLTSRRWIDRPAPVRPAGATFLRRLCLAVSACVLVQLVLGAALRHFTSGHTLVTHVLFAIVIVFLVGWLVMWTVGQFPRERLIATPAKSLGVLTALQLMLGGFAWIKTMTPAARGDVWAWLVPTAHVGVGALILVSSVMLTVALLDHARADASARAVSMEAMPT